MPRSSCASEAIARDARGFRRAVAGDGARRPTTGRGRSGSAASVPLRLDDRRARLRGGVRASGRGSGARSRTTSATRSRRSSPGRGARAMRRCSTTRSASTGSTLARPSCASARTRSRRAVADCPAELRAALELAAARIERLPRAASCPTDHELRRCAGRPAGAALAADRRGRALRAGRHRRLSELGADERDAGPDRRASGAW